LIVVGVFVYSLFSHLSNFFEHRIMTVVDKTTNERHTWAIDTDLSLNETYRTVFLWLVDGALLSIIPFILLLVLNTRLIWEVSNVSIIKNLVVKRLGLYDHLLCCGSE
jgi:hypothetical protein